MPLLKPPDPRIPTKKYYIRLEEPVARTMERYAEFLGTPNIDHLVTQALEFVFRRDADFKEWLAQHPESPDSKANATRKGKSPSSSGGDAIPANRNGREEVEL